MLKPGTYVATIAGIDFAKGKDHMAGLIAHLNVDGTILIHHTWQIADGLKIKVHTKHDMIDMPHFSTWVGRNRRNRHHKRKPQPNHGPQGRNQW